MPYLKQFALGERIPEQVAGYQSPPPLSPMSCAAFDDSPRNNDPMYVLLFGSPCLLIFLQLGLEQLNSPSPHQKHLEDVEGLLGFRLHEKLMSPVNVHNVLPQNQREDLEIQMDVQLGEVGT